MKREQGEGDERMLPDVNSHNRHQRSRNQVLVVRGLDLELLPSPYYQPSSPFVKKGKETKNAPPPFPRCTPTKPTHSPARPPPPRPSASEAR